MGNCDYQVVVVGAGPGGYVAAIRAAQLGLRTAIVERSELGGVCLNWGCIPTKALLHSADVFRTARESLIHGVILDVPPRFDLAVAVKRSRTIAAHLSQGVRGLLTKNKVTVIEGQACLLGEGRITVDAKPGEQGEQREQRELRAEHIILATGARPRSLPGFDLNHHCVWTAREAMTPDSLPKSIVVIGAGAIGVEFASFYAALGTDVTLLEGANQILPHEDEEIATLLARRLQTEGITVHTDAQVDGCSDSDQGLQVHYRQGGNEAKVLAERVIMAVGIRGNIEELGLENTQVEVKNEHLVVDQWCRTAEAGVYAIGDVAGPPWLAHKASHEAVACVNHIAGLPEAHVVDPDSVPSCIYCHPQVASVGLSEATARERGHEVAVGRFPFQASGKALTLNDSEGLVKTIFDKVTGELLGAHMIGPDVTELIGTYATARVLESTEHELIQTVFPHPTLSEALHESVLAAFDRPLHI